MIILGSGMAGTLMGAINNDAIIYEAQSEVPNNHSAVLRFREDKISKTIGVPFRKVKVYKTIWYDGQERKPSPRFSNMYSSKVTGKVSDRSINNIDPVERFVAPSDFHLILANICGKRINFNMKVIKIDPYEIRFDDGLFNCGVHRERTPIISTMPMKILSQVTAIPLDEEFQFNKISVARFKVPDCDVHQTVYFPSPDTKIYRATLTGSDLIVESMADINIIMGSLDLDLVAESLGISCSNFLDGTQVIQRYGKILPIDDSARKNFMFRCTQDLAIYSLGRFACWKNILLDDVYDDIFKIKAMMKSDLYDLKRSYQ